MHNHTDIQIASSSKDTPSSTDIDDWIRSALDSVQRTGVELTVRVVDESEIVTLNKRYRNKDQSTDVLAFPAEPLTQIDPTPLGDVVVCAPVVDRQAQTLQQPRDSHWARIVAHGVLHLCGYDHQTPDEASEMESIEDAILNRLGLATCAKSN